MSGIVAPLIDRDAAAGIEVDLERRRRKPAALVALCVGQVSLALLVGLRAAQLEVTAAGAQAESGAMAVQEGGGRGAERSFGLPADLRRGRAQVERDRRARPRTNRAVPVALLMRTSAPEISAFSRWIAGAARQPAARPHGRRHRAEPLPRPRRVFEWASATSLLSPCVSCAERESVIAPRTRAQRESYARDRSLAR